MPADLPTHAILSVMREVAEAASDTPLEALCVALANILEEQYIQADDDLFGQLVLLGAGIWRHTGMFKAGGAETVQ